MSRMSFASSPLGREFMQIAESEIEARGLDLEQDAREAFAELTEAGAQQVQPPGIDKARQDLITFVDRAVESARERRRRSIDIEAMRAAKKRCGLFPWCMLKVRWF